MTSRTLAALALAAGLALAAAPANALDSLTGSYAGKLACKGAAAGVPGKSKRDLVIQVLDGKSPRFIMTADGAPLGGVTRLVVSDDPAKPDRGRIAGIDCTLDQFTFTGVVVQGDAVSKPGNVKATLKGTVLFYSSSGNVYDTCTFTAKRTATDSPKVDVCAGS